MASATQRYVVKDITDENGHLRVTMRAKTQAEGSNAENPLLHSDAVSTEQLIFVKLKSAAISTLFQKTKDVLVTFSGPA